MTTLEHAICRYCGATFTRLRKWPSQRLAAVCKGEACRARMLADAGRKGGRAALPEVKSAARRAAWARVRGEEVA